MNRERNRRSFASVDRARRIRPMHAASRPLRTDRRSPAGPATASPAAEEAALAFLSEILVGDHAWTTAEVQRLVSMRESAGLGRWRDTGLDDEATVAG